MINDKVKEIIEKVMPCNCIPAYKDRNMSAPDCPNCNYEEDITDAITQWIEDALPEEKEIKYDTSGKINEAYGYTNEIYNQAIQELRKRLK